LEEAIRKNAKELGQLLPLKPAAAARYCAVIDGYTSDKRPGDDVRQPLDLPPAPFCYARHHWPVPTLVANRRRAVVTCGAASI
jgi:hypothetical protein